jgi:exodeoxyribonuclease VII large subunit
MTETYALYDLQTYIRRVIAANLQDTVWITAEISTCGISRGHYYIDLVEKNENGNEIKARADAVLWAKDATKLHKKLGFEVVQNLLQAGRQVRLLVRVDYHEQYGMKLIVNDIDPTHTVGQLEMLRREVLLQLQSEYLLDANKEIPLPLVPQRIVLISSASAAGYQDFIAHLFNNVYGYTFEITLFDCAMQGVAVERDVLAAFEEIDAQATSFDAVAILRGGGSRLDLACFDTYALAARAAVLQLPLIVGIGHDIDESVLDIVANTSLKTPTAVADFLIESMARFEQSLHLMMQRLRVAQQRTAEQHALLLERTMRTLHRIAQQAIQQREQQLNKIQMTLPHLLNQKITKCTTDLAQAEQKIRLLDPNIVLQRGFSMTILGDKPIINAAIAQKGDIVETLTANGRFYSVVQ